MGGRVRTNNLDEGIVEVIIDQPDRLNAMSLAMWDGFTETMRALNIRNDVRCIILTGAGDRAFSAGADISEFEQIRSTAKQAKAYAKHTHAGLESLRNCRHPVVAAIRGLCVGGGLELACQVDIRICDETARFGIPIQRLGLVVAHSEMQALIELVGKGNALQILLEGEIYGPNEALRMGLVNRVVSMGNLAAAALTCARKIADGAPLVARWHKKFVNRLMDPRPLNTEEIDESYHCFDTEDYRIGKKAFLDKTKPIFVGR